MANRLKFDADTHTYLLGGTPLISVTQLLHKHGLVPDYGGVDGDVLERKAARGTLIHREIEAWIKTGEDGFTTELAGFQALAKQYAFTCMRSETRVHNDIIAGTADLMCGAKMPDGRRIRLLADIKTTARIHTEYARWQLSVYEYLSGRTFDELAVIHLGEQARLITVPARKTGRGGKADRMRAERKDIYAPARRAVHRAAGGGAAGRTCHPQRGNGAENCGRACQTCPRAAFAGNGKVWRDRLRERVDEDHLCCAHDADEHRHGKTAGGKPGPVRRVYKGHAGRGVRSDHAEMSAGFRAAYNGCVTDEDGGLILSFRAEGDGRAAAKRAAQWARKSNRELAVDVRPYREKRSLTANAYFHVLVGEIAERLSVSEQEAKRQLVLEYGAKLRDETGTVVGMKLPASVEVNDIYPYARQFDERVENGKRFYCYLLYKPTHTLNTQEMCRLIDGAVHEAKELGIETATPQELAKMKALLLKEKGE